MDVGIMQFPPGDSRMIDKIVHQLKSQGIFDQFRKECIADVDTKPAYQNLHQRVESTVSTFLASQVWRPDLNKNQLRDSLRKHIHESGFLDIGVERIVDQVVNPKIKTVFMPQVEDVVYSYLGIDRPKKGKENLNVHVAPLTIENLARREQKKLPTLTDLLPKELEPISPASDTKGIDTSFEEGEVREDNLLNEGKEADDEETSPPFEPIADVNTHEESSVDSHLSGISELTSHGSQHSPVPPAITTTAATQLDNSSLKVHTFDFTNNDSQLSKVSSGSRLSIVSFSETDNDQSKVLPDVEVNEGSQQSRVSSQDTQYSVSMDAYTPTKAGECSQDGKMSPMLHLNTKDLDENNIGNNAVVDNLTDSEHVQDQTDGGKVSDIPEKEFKKENADDEIIPTDKVTETLGENNEIMVKKENGIYDKELQILMCKSDDKMEIDLCEREDKAKEREHVQNIKELDLSEKCEKGEEKNIRKTEESMDRKLEFEAYKKHEEKQEKAQDYILEKQMVEKQQKADDKSEKKQEERLDKKSEEKVEKKHEKSEKKLDEKYGKKHDEKSDKKYDNKTENHKDKSEERSEKRANEKSEKKADDRQEKRCDEKCDKKVDSKSDKKFDERKSEKSKDSRERSRDKRDDKRKEITGSSKDSKRSDSLDGEKKRSDKDKHKKDRSESRNRSEKSSRHDNKESKEKDVKEKQKHEEKNDREGVKSKHKQDRDAKEDKKTEEKERKAERESNKEKVRKEDSESLKHEKDLKKKDKEGKERNKSDEKPRSKHDDRHKDRTKSTESKSDKEKSRDEKNSKDGNKSAGKETKDRTKQESKDRGKSDSKDTSVKYDEKKNKDKKYDDKDGRDKSSRSSDKGNSKTPEKRKDDSESSKPSRSEHKHKEGGRKNKDSKSKGASDDHRIHREKHSEDRRSTDRDSNGTAQDRVGNISRTNCNDSQRSHSHRTKTNGNNNNSKTDNRGNSECAEMINETVKEEIQSPITNSPPSSLPFKKRPYSEHNEVKEYQSSISSAGKLVLKTKKKPKIAANIFEVKKIMQLRKSIAKKERKQQKKLRKLKKRKTHDENEVQSVKRLVAPDKVKRVKLGELENSLRKEVKKSLTNKELMPANNEKEADIKYFASEVDSQWISQKDANFLAFVKRLDKSETLSELSTDTEDEVEEQLQHKVSIPYELLEPLVAEEIGAKLVRSDGKVHIIFDHAISLKSHNNMDNASPASEVPKCNQSDSLKADGESVPLIQNKYDRSASVSEQPLEITLDEHSGQLGNRPSSVNSINSSDSCIIVEESVTNKPEQHCVKNTKQRGISNRRASGKSQDIQEIKPPQEENDKKERRRLLRPSMRYSSKEYASTCMTSEGHLQQGGNEGYEALLNEEAAPMSSVSEHTPSKSKTDNSTTKKVPKKTLAPSGLHKTRAARTLSAFVSDTEDESPVSNDNYSFETGYCVIKDNNNIDKDVDKDLSEDEKGNDIPLNQELILSTLQDLMIESGYHKPDIPANIIHTVRGTSLDSQSHNQESTEVKRPKLGRSRRVGLGKPIRNSGNQSSNDNGGSRTATPPSADFVMPLSPESDVSASSGDAKKGAHDTKVTDGPLEPSPSNSDGKTSSDIAEGEHRRTLRSSGAQRYTSDDLYKPRPLFTPGSRRSRNRPASPIEETVTSCAMKRPATSMDVADTPPSSKRRR